MGYLERVASRRTTPFEESSIRACDLSLKEPGKSLLQSNSSPIRSVDDNRPAGDRRLWFRRVFNLERALVAAHDFVRYQALGVTRV